MLQSISVSWKIVASFVLGAAVACSTVAAQDSPSTGLRIAQTPTAVTITSGPRTVLEYCPQASPQKPYVRQLFTPAGVQILRDSPHDHKHHHALMFAVAVDGVNFWEEVNKSGSEIPLGIDNVRSASVDGRPTASFAQRLQWRAADGQPLLEERRSIAVHAGPEIPATLVTWRSRLDPPAGKATARLTGSHYQGLGLRFIESMDVAGRFFNSEDTEGTTVRGSERVGASPVVRYASTADGKPVTVAIFASPKNVRGAHFFTMRPFAYLSVTLNLWKEPIELKAGQGLDLCYGVAVWDGTIDSDHVEKLYRKWIELQP